MPWDAEEYAIDLANSAQSSGPALEAQLATKYPPLIGIDEFIRLQAGSLPLIVGPAVVTDKMGRILVWCLPRILSEHRQVSAFREIWDCGTSLPIEEQDTGLRPHAGGAADHDGSTRK